MSSRRAAPISLLFAFCVMAACGGDTSSEPKSETSVPVKTASQNSVDACLAAAKATNDADKLEAQLACAMTVTDKVTVKFVGTDETYGCSPQIVGVAPTDSPREYVRFAVQHGDGKEYTGVIRLENKVLPDRKSGWRTYGWPGNPPLEPCSELPMKVTSITCKRSGEQDYSPCEDDVDLLLPGLFASEEMLK